MSQKGDFRDQGRSAIVLRWHLIVESGLKGYGSALYLNDVSGKLSLLFFLASECLANER